MTTALPLTICYVAEDANLASVAGTLDGVTFYGCTTAYFTGAHDLVVTASDWAGNAATTRLTFTIAGGPLAVAAITPSEGAVVAGQADVLVAVSSALGVETVVANGVTLVEEAAGYYHGVVMLTEGPNAIQVLAHDTAGNAASVVLNVISDTTPPSLTVTSPADGALVGDFLVAGSVSDATAVTVTVNSPCGPNGLCRRPISVGPTGQFSTTISPPAGPYDIAVVATDAAGNVSPTIVRHVTSCPTGAACGGKATCRCSASYACVVDPGFMTLCYDGAGNMTARLLNAAGQPCSTLQSCP